MKAIVLAAGKGTRMNSQEVLLPKVLREACGKPLLTHVLTQLNFIAPSDTVLVVGFMRETVQETIGSAYQYAVQDPQMGTGHAVMCALPKLENYHGPVMVSFGDMPLLTKKTYQAVCAPVLNGETDCCVLTANIPNPPPYGRIVRDENGQFLDIVEDKDCTQEQKKIIELNIGINVYRADLLREYINLLSSENAQKEYYITKMPAIFRQKGHKVATVPLFDIKEMLGVNTPDDLAEVERVLLARG